MNHLGDIDNWGDWDHVVYYFKWIIIFIISLAIIKNAWYGMELNLYGQSQTSDIDSAMAVFFTWWLTNRLVKFNPSNS